MNKKGLMGIFSIARDMYLSCTGTNLQYEAKSGSVRGPCYPYLESLNV